jgi:hypothetical protein
MYKFVIYFIGIQLALFSLEQSNNVHTNIIIPFTEMIAHISVWVVKLFDDNVISARHIDVPIQKLPDSTAQGKTRK